MNFKLKYPVLIGTALLTGSLLIGCSSTKKPAVPAAPVAVVDPTADAKDATPGIKETETAVVTAKVQAINKKKRTVTLKFPDGKTTKITCGPEIRNFPQIQVGDDVTAEFKETVELYLDKTKGAKAGGSTVEAVERAPLGGKPGGAIVKSGEISAVVQSIDYDTRKVVLQGSNGKVMSVTAGPKVTRLKDVKVGDVVVARYTEALAIEVTSPGAASK